MSEIDKVSPSESPVEAVDAAVEKKAKKPASKSPSKAASSKAESSTSSSAKADKPEAKAKRSSGSSANSASKPSAATAKKVVKKKIIKKTPVKRVLKDDSLASSVQKKKFKGVLVELSAADAKIKIPADAVHEVGKRKEAIARVWVWPIAKGQKSVVLVNGRDPISYFNNSPKALLDISKPFLTIDEEVSNYCLVSTLSGGGVSAQSEALRLGVSKCLLGILPHMRPALKKEKLLRRDARVVEPKKTGLRGARKREQFSKR